MFYDSQSIENRNKYKKMLQIVGMFSNLFSNSIKPYLSYRAHENIFCKYFSADNLSRYDISIDAKIGDIGIGLKTWINTNTQKISEFNKLKPYYENLKGLDLITLISTYRNNRLTTTKEQYGLNNMIYHIIKRDIHQMSIHEKSIDLIDTSNLELLSHKHNNIHFTDKKNTYNFNTSKNTLYMNFDNMDVIDKFNVNIIQDPYSLLEQFSLNIINVSSLHSYTPQDNQLCLKLYSYNKKNGNYIPLHSGLNQWNAKGRDRNNDEIYIPYPSHDRNKNLNFFPERDTPFSLKLPNGNEISAKVCQDDNKAIMSNPNNALGKWLLRDVLKIDYGEIVTYKMLLEAGIDSVIFTKNSDLNYNINFAKVGTYNKFNSTDLLKTDL